MHTGIGLKLWHTIYIKDIKNGSYYKYTSNVLFKPEIELQQFSNTKNGLGFGKSQNTVKIN